jgi:hypothetical protein
MGHRVIPLERPRPAWGRSSLTSSSRRPSMPLYSRPALPVRTAAVPSRSSEGGPVAGRRAQLRHRRAAPSWRPRVSCQLPIDEPRGPRPQPASLRDATESEAGPRRDGGGSHRRQPGCREQSCPHSRATEGDVTHARGNALSTRAAGRRAVRPLASPGRWCLLPSGPAYEQAVRTDGEGAFGRQEGRLVRQRRSDWRQDESARAEAVSASSNLPSSAGKFAGEILRPCADCSSMA